ncbi:hypothetical protein [Flavobacterium johnsoniae]|uniref:hypothetical protein n=1 Tax=Flavobacterium johnsoniae TaxID=986 RepID=UPI003D95A42D
MTQNQEQNKPASQGDSLGLPKFAAAIVLFIAYLIFIAYMLHESKTTELAWTRMLYIFSGLEAIVFAALGYVFGKDIHRIRAEKAEENEVKAKKEADTAKRESEIAKDKAQREKEKGIQLSSAVLSRNQQSLNENVFHFEALKATKGVENIVSGDSYLIDLANMLYPGSTATMSFDYEITPADKIKSITIDGITEYEPKGTFVGVHFPGNRFVVHVEKITDFDDWTFTISRISCTDSIRRKQVGGKLVSNGYKGTVKLENV